MTNEIAFTIMIALIALAGVYMAWWTHRQERKQEHGHESQ